jgi:AraC-like DNA-binding protein
MAEQQEQQKRPGGRPRLTFDLRLVEDLGKIQSTHSELAAVLGVSIETVKRRLKDDPEFCAVYEKGLENGKSSLRRIQWKAALAGNTTMQIWLGKQYLQQRDMHSAELTGAKGEPLIPARMVTGLNDATRTLLRDLRGRLPRTGQEGALPAPGALAALPTCVPGAAGPALVPDASRSEGDPA